MASRVATAPAPMVDALRRASAEDAGALYRAGAAAVRAGEDEEALPLLRRAVARHPRDAGLWQVLGLANRNLDRLSDAVDAFARARSLAPNDGLIAHSLARSTMEAGLPAVDAYLAAARLAPNDGAVLQGLAAAHWAAGEGERAKRGLVEALRREPLWIDGQATLVRLRHLSGEPDEFASYREALARHPRAASLWMGLLALLTASERYERVCEVVAAARGALGPGEGLDLYEAIAADETNDVDTAAAIFARLPTDQVAVALRKVRHLIRRGRMEEAAALAERHVGGAGGRAFWPYLALAWRVLGDARRTWLEGDPAFVRVIDLGWAAGDLRALAERLRGLHVATHQPLDQSVRGGTQTDGPLLSRIEPEIVRLRAAIVDAVAHYRAALPVPAGDTVGHPLLTATPSRIRFAGSWSVRLQGGGRHADHVHPAGWISSALYVSLPEPAGGEAGWLTLGGAEALVPGLAPIRSVEPRAGRLVLFPSTMWHGTRPFAAGERLTAAFDVAPDPRA